MKSEMQSYPASNGLLTLDEDTLKSLIKLEPITDVYDVEQAPFARGKFAAVRRLVHKVTGVAYAGKFIRKRRRSMDQRQEILHEVAVLKMAGSARRIVKLLEVYETPSEMALVLELAAGGELQRMVDIQDGLDEPEAVVVMKQVLEALVFLHNENIAHLDLKPQNMLLTRDYPDTDIVLCDFGISRIIQDGVEVKEILGTPDYVAPEILSYEPISLATDIWSVGVLAYVLLSGYSPFAGDTKQQTFCNISQCALNFPPELFDGVSPAALHFIQSTLVIDPSCRLSAEECLRHPWLTGSPLPPSAVVVATSSTAANNSSSSPSSTSTGANKGNDAVDSTSNSPSPPPFICLSCSKCGGSTSCHHQHHHNHLRHDLTNTVVLPDRGIIC